MPLTLTGTIASGELKTDLPIPDSFPKGPVLITLTPLTSVEDQPPVTAGEMAQGESGFIQTILLNPSENVWDND